MPNLSAFLYFYEPITTNSVAFAPYNLNHQLSFGGVKMQAKTLGHVINLDKHPVSRISALLRSIYRMAPTLLVALFLGRAALFGELSPFPLAFFVAVRLVVPGGEWLTGAVLALGVLLRGNPMQAVSFIAMALAYLALERAIGFSSKERLVRAGLAGVAVIVVRLPLFMWQPPTLFEGIVTLIEGGLTMVLAVVFVHAANLLAAFSLERRWKAEEMMAMAVTGAVVLLGLEGLATGNVSAQGIALKYLVILSAYMGGATWGATMGVAAPFIVYLAHPLALTHVGSFAFGGLVAGALKDWRKAGVAIGFTTAMALSAANLGSREYLGAIVLECLIAGILLFFTSRQSRSRLYRLLPMSVREDAQLEHTYASRLQSLAGKRMRDLCEVFAELAETFRDSAVPDNIPGQAATKLMERLAREVCEDCITNRVCWGKEFYHTYQNMLELLALSDVHGACSVDMLPEHLRKRCAKPKEMVHSLNSLTELYRQNMYWEKRAQETRHLVANQLQGVAKIMASLSSELNLEVQYLKESEERIQKELAARGVFSPSVEVVKSDNGRIEVTITKHACNPGENHCATVLVPLLTEVLGRQVSRDTRRCAALQGKTKCSVCLSTAHVLAVDTGVAQVACSEGVCGDSYKVSELTGGKLALMVSDGMGDGPLASQESRATITLLEQMMRAGFDKEITVQTINSVLALRSQGETFATVDMALVDLYSGATEIVKIGASSSYLKRGDRVEVIRAAGLPAGILANIEVDTRKLMLYSGDILVMLSDGVMEGQQGIIDKEEWLSRILRQATVERAQDLADYILNRAKNNFGGKIPDDMTVVVLKILDKAVSIPLVG